MLAAEKKRQDEWKASQGSSFTATTAPKAKAVVEDDEDFPF